MRVCKDCTKYGVFHCQGVYQWCYPTQRALNYLLHDRLHGPAWRLSFIYQGGSIESFAELKIMRPHLPDLHRWTKSKSIGEVFDMVTTSLVQMIFCVISSWLHVCRFHCGKKMNEEVKPQVDKCIYILPLWLDTGCNSYHKVSILLTSLYCLIADLFIYFIAYAPRSSDANSPAPRSHENNYNNGNECFSCARLFIGNVVKGK